MFGPYICNELVYTGSTYMYIYLLIHPMSILRLEDACVYLPVECIAIVQQAGVPVKVMWQLGRDTSHVPACLEYSRAVRLEIDQGIWVASLVRWHNLTNTSLSYCRHGVGRCLARSENCF